MPGPVLRHISFAPLFQYPRWSDAGAGALHQENVFEMADLQPWRALLVPGSDSAYGIIGIGSRSPEAKGVIGFLPVHLPDASLPVYLRVVGRTTVPLKVDFVRQRLAASAGEVFGEPPEVDRLAGRTIAPDDPTPWILDVSPRWIVSEDGTASPDAVVDNARFWYGLLVQSEVQDGAGAPATSSRADLTGITIAYYERADPA